MFTAFLLFLVSLRVTSATFISTFTIKIHQRQRNTATTVVSPTRTLTNSLNPVILTIRFVLWIADNETIERITQTHPSVRSLFRPTIPMNFFGVGSTPTPVFHTARLLIKS